MKQVAVRSGAATARLNGPPGRPDKPGSSKFWLVQIQIRLRCAPDCGKGIVNTSAEWSTCVHVGGSSQGIFFLKNRPDRVGNAVYLYRSHPIEKWEGDGSLRDGFCDRQV